MSICTRYLRVFAANARVASVGPNPVACSLIRTTFDAHNATRHAAPYRSFHVSLAQSRATPTDLGESDRQTVKHASQPPLSSEHSTGKKRFADFDLAGKAYVVTGGAQGLGLALAEALAEAGGKVYCLDRSPKPGVEWDKALGRVVSEWGGSLNYRQQDVSDTEGLDRLIGAIADENQGLHGVVAAAGIQQVTPAVEYTEKDVAHMMSINYTGVFMTATSAARQMLKYKCDGSIVFIASMSGSVANKGLLSPVYNSSKAALIQLARSLAMEWSPRGIRVNCLSPGHILTPMVLKNFEDDPSLREKWERENMMGRLADTAEFKGAALFLISKASSFSE